MSDSTTRSRDSMPRRMRVIAVTGVSGKTTTAWLTASVLSEAGLRVGVVSDLGCVDADGGLAAAPDRRRPDVLDAWITRLERSGCTHAVVEVAPDLLVDGGLGRGVCDVIVVTGSSRTGCGNRAARAALVRRTVAALAPDGCLIAPPCRGLRDLFAAAARSERCTAVVAGLDDSCDVSARPVERGLHGQMFLLSAAGQVAPVAVDPPVASFARNAACAAAVGIRYGVPLDLAARGVDAAGSVAGRVERLDRGQDFAAFLDGPTSGHALASTLTSLRRLTPGRLAVVAEQGLVDMIGPAAFAGPVRRLCDDVVVAPHGVLDEVADETTLAAYARIDLLLGRLGPRDCVLVLGGTPGDEFRSSGAPVATLVDGWLRLAHPPRRAVPGPRRAA